MYFVNRLVGGQNIIEKDAFHIRLISLGEELAGYVCNEYVMITVMHHKRGLDQLRKAAESIRKFRAKKTMMGEEKRTKKMGRARLCTTSSTSTLT